MLAINRKLHLITISGIENNFKNKIRFFIFLISANQKDNKF